MADNRNNNNRNRNRNRNRNQGGSTGGQRRPPNKRFSKKPLSGGRIIQKYDNLQDQHLQARKKYFEMYHRIDDRGLEKLKRIFDETLDNLRRFEEKLEDWQKETLAKKIDAYKLDTIYSEGHETGLLGDNVPDGPFKNPHVTDAQINRDNYANDREETMGTIEDYEKYKDL